MNVLCELRAKTKDFIIHDLLYRSCRGLQRHVCDSKVRSRLYAEGHVKARYGES